MNLSPNQREPRADLYIRKLIGRLSLHAGRVKEALDIYIRLLEEYPREMDVVLIVANLYLYSGYRLTAEKLYEQVRQSGSVDWCFEQQLALTREMSGGIKEEKVEAAPLQSPAVDRLVERLYSLESHSQEGQCVRQAADILEKSTDPAFSAGEPIHQAGTFHDQRLPTLIEQYIKQARLDDQFELADVLVSLRLSLLNTMENGKP